MKKKSLIIIIILSTSIIISMILFICYSSMPNSKINKGLIVKGTEKDFSDPGNINVSTGSYEDCENIEDLPYKAYLTNTAELNYNLNVYAQESFLYYLTNYLNYYKGEEGTWTVTYIQDSFQSDNNFPSFYVEVNEYPGEQIRCVYNTCEKKYKFNCSNIENLKK